MSRCVPYFFLLNTEFFFRKYYNIFNRERTGQRTFCCWDVLWTFVPRLKVLVFDINLHPVYPTPAGFIENSTLSSVTCVLGTPLLQLGLDDTYSWILFSCVFSSDSTMSACVASFFFQFVDTLNLPDNHNDFVRCLHLANVQTKQQDGKIFLNFFCKISVSNIYQNGQISELSQPVITCSKCRK